MTAARFMQLFSASTNALMKLRLAAFCFILVAISSNAAEPPAAPAKASRFPALQLPDGFRSVLVAADPLVEYPSVIALGPRPGSLFVAHDYMTGLGKGIMRRSEVRLLEDTDSDGAADKSTIYAGEFNSIQGLEFHFGEVFVMHAPYLTRLRDKDGDGKADERRDLIVGLGYKPEDDPIRLHSANGVVAAHDGWLYLALGDHGCDVQRPEGDRLKLEGGGILRCRRDGSDLHIFSTGLRNIYDLALDEELNVFVRDNENDGGAYKNRVYHSFHGADHGYPYLYYEYPHETMAPLADVGLGSSAGGVCYLETAFPAAYRGNLFFCEWGKSVVTYSRRRSGSSFRPLKEVVFATGGAGDTYPFKTTDVVVDRDGTLLISDWADGQRPKRGRGRIYRIVPSGKTRLPSPTQLPRGLLTPAQLAVVTRSLNYDSHHSRVLAQRILVSNGAAGLAAVTEALAQNQLQSLGRLHACWVLALVGGEDSLDSLFDLAANDSDARVRAQAVRAIADLTDPILQQDRLDAGRGDAKVAARLARLGNDAPRQLKFEVIIALGRLKWAGLPNYLRKSLRKPDAAMNHAAMQALRRCDAWGQVVKLLDAPNTNPVKALARWAVAGQADPVVVRGLIQRLAVEKDVRLLRRYADHLTRVHRKPVPWEYWGFRPPPRPVNTVDWEQTAFIEHALNEALNHPDPGIHTQTLKRMQAREVPVRLQTLTRLLGLSRNHDIVASVLKSLAQVPAKESRDALSGVIHDSDHTRANRVEALNMLNLGLDIKTESRLLAIAKSVEDGPVAVEAIRALGGRDTIDSQSLLIAKTKSLRPDVRAAAIESLTRLRYSSAHAAAHEGLFDKSVQVRIAAAKAAGALKIGATSQRLKALLKEANPELHAECLTALRALGIPAAIP